MLRVGLTGGIACGKSNALRCFRKLGAHVMDADILAREVVEPGRPAHDEIVREFGSQVLGSGGGINRKALGKIIFADEAARQKLNRIVHPYVLEEIDRRIAGFESDLSRSKSPVTIVDASLMIETGTYLKYQVIVIAYCSPAIQLRRLMRREQISEEEARQRINSQMPILEKVKYGDYILDTSGKHADTYLQINQVYAELLARYEEGLGI